MACTANYGDVYVRFNSCKPSWTPSTAFICVCVDDDTA